MDVEFFCQNGTKLTEGHKNFEVSTHFLHADSSEMVASCGRILSQQVGMRSEIFLLVPPIINAICLSLLNKKKKQSFIKMALGSKD